MSASRLADAERLDWLRLARSPNVGPVTFYRLLERFGSAAAALRALPGLTSRGGRRDLPPPVTSEQAERELVALAAAGGRLMTRRDGDYPLSLAALDDAPPVISVIGDTRLAERPAVAVVGTRNASINGRRLAERVAADLAAAGVVVVSGLARGIDGAAHHAALEGGTIAVLAGGIDIVYPREHESLYREIAARGLLVAEMPFGTQPQAGHFPRRNRLVAGLSLGVVVIEAAAQSGALITARLALEQGREVFAVPGSPLDPRSRGPNDLLRQGATLTETADDVLAVIAAMVGRPWLDRSRAAPESVPTAPPVGEADLAPARERIVEALSPVPAPVDEVVRRCQLSAAVVASVLLELELAGRLERHPGQRVALLDGS
jgi:DNA processing protein